MTRPAPSVPDRLRAAATAAQAAMANPAHPAPLDVAAMWQPAVDALIDLADVLEPPHDPTAAAIVAALTDTGATR